MAHAAVILTMADTDGLKYDHATAKNIVGTGTTAGDIVLYPNVGAFGGYAIDGVVTTGAITGSIDSYDSPGKASTATGASNYFMIDTTGGSATLTFTYYVAGTYTGPNTGIPVTLQNVKINSIDIDSSSNSASYQYSEFTSSQNYSLTSDTNLRVVPMTNPTRVRFQAGLTGMRSSVPQDQVLVRYTTVNSLSITFGNVMASQTNYFGVIFGPWSNTGTPIEYGNLYATIPTSTSTSINVPETLTSGTTFPINVSAFGNYGDAGGNAFSQVQITGITPTTAGTLKYNGANITANQNITVADIESGLVTWVPAGNASATPVVVTFYVNNGVYNSAATYTLTLNPVGSSQSINFTTPTSKTVGTVFNSGANATSSLPVTVTSSTTGVCTVSSADSLTVTAVAVGTCVLTATQAGNASYSAATPVTVKFLVVSATATSQTITFTAPANQTTGAKVSTSPTASSGLTVSLASLTPVFCSVSGFDISAVAAGSCQIQATQAGNATYSAATSVTRTFTISDPATGSVAPVARTTMAGVKYNSSKYDVTLSGRVDPNGQATTYQFCLSNAGSTTNDTITGTSVTCNTPASVASASILDQQETYTITDIQASNRSYSSTKTFYYQIVAWPTSSPSSKVYGHVFPFTISGSSSSSIPQILTNSASSLTTSSAVLNGYWGRPIPKSSSSYLYYETSTVTYCLNTNQAMTPSSGKLNSCAATLTGATKYDTNNGSSSTVISTSDSATASGLSAATTYYYQAIANYAQLKIKQSDSSTTTTVKTVYGNLVSFTTSQPAPSVTTNSASGVSGTVAKLNGSVSNYGTSTTLYFLRSSASTTSGGALSSSPIYETATPSSTSATGSLAFIANLSGLTSGSTYYFQAVIKVGGTATYGAVKSFVAGNPTAQTLGASDLTSGGTWSVVLNGYTMPNGVTAIQNFCHVIDTYTVNAAGAITSCTVDTATVQTVTVNSVDSATVTGLTGGHTYYFQAMAKNNANTALVGYGAVLSFTTVSPPTVTSVAASAITATTATLNGTINPNSAITTGSFCLSSSATVDDGGVLQTCNLSPASTPATVGSGASTTNISAGVTGLTPGTTYYFQAVGQNAAGTSYGSVLNFVTGLLPTAVVSPATNIRTTGGSSYTAQLNGTVSANGLGLSATIKFCWASGVDPTILDAAGLVSGCTLVNGAPSSVSGTSSFVDSATVSSLTAGTTYYFQIQAFGTNGTVSSSVMSFIPGSATVTTDSATALTTTSAIVWGSTKTGPTTAATQSLCVSTSSDVDPSGSGSLASCLKSGNAVSGILAKGASSAVVDSFTATGLTSGTQYWYQNQAVDTTTPATTYGSINTFTTWGVVTYDGNGADNASTQTQSGSASTTTLSPTTTYTRTNYTLGSWNTKSDGSGTSYALGAAFNFKSNLSLYAIWTPNFLVQFNSESGTAVSNQTYSGTPLSLSSPTRTGYNFAGWFLAASGGSAITSPYSPTGPITLHAQWTLKSVTITFDAAAGAFSVAPLNQRPVSVTYGTDALSSAPAAPTLAGNNFQGWSETSTSLTTLPSYTVTETPTTLYAIYSVAVVTYTVTFDTSTATSGSASSATVSATAGNSVNLATANTLTRTGWTLDGWTKSGSETIYSLGSAYTPPANVTMYPHWTPTYTVIFNGNNSSSGTMSNQTGTGTSFYLAVNAFSRTGYTWDHWSDTSTANVGITYNNAQLVSIKSPLNLTLYAQWNAISYTYNYSVSYDGNGADNSGAMSSQSGNSSSFTLTANAFNRTGYDFVGWSDTNTVGGTDYIDQQPITLSHALTTTLYAKWAPRSYSVSYSYGSGGTPGGTLPNTVSTYHPGDTFTVASGSGLSNTGWTFGGWSDGLGDTFNAGDTDTVGTVNISLSGIWNRNSYTVTFDANTGHFNPTGSDTTTSISYGFDALINAPDSSTVTGPVGKTIFNGWSETSNGYPIVSYVLGAAPKTFYAVWSAVAIKYTITYKKSAGETGTAPAAISNLAGTDQFLPDTGTSLSKTGYDFVDWVGESGNTYLVDGTPYSVGYSSDTLTAEWVPKHFDITYDGNGGTFSGDTSTVVSQHYGALVTDGDPMPYLDGTHEFVGWNIDSSSATTYDTYTVGLTNPTYYAIWRVVSTYNYTITFDANGGDGGAYMSPQTGKAGSILLNANTYTFTGKTFTGWNTSADGSGTPYSNSGTIVITTATTLTLYAQWTANSGGGSSLPAAILTWRNPANITYPTPLSGVQLNAVANVPGTYLYTPAAGTVLNPGTYTLLVRFTPTSNSQYGPATASVTITVLSGTKTTPTIRWSTPTSITYPTPLSGAQLNASCSVPGTLTYNPGLRAILQPGTYTLQVTCNPTSSTYSSVSAQVYLIVLKKAEVVQNNPITELPKELPGGNSSYVITTPEAPGVGIKEAEIVGGKLVTKPEPTFSGKTTVSVTVTNNGEESTVLIPVIVPPNAPVAESSPQTLREATVKWEPSSNATSYAVVYRGSVVCETTETSCTLPNTVGPKTPVNVIAKGNDDTQNEVKPTLVIEKPIPALVVNFNLSSATLTLDAKLEMKSVAAIIKREGFTRLVVTGHTDIQTGIDNQLLSKARAAATKAYLEKLLPTVKFKIGAYADKKPVADNTSQAGFAANRRAEISVW